MDLMQVLFDLETYAAAKVSKPDNDTIICDQVNGQPLRITFRKKIEHWEVRIDVSANKLDEPAPNWVRLMSGRAADEAQRQFWDALALRAFEDSRNEQEARCSWALVVRAGS